MAINAHFQNDGQPPSWILSEVKFDLIESRDRQVPISPPNFVQVSQRATELWRFTCFQNGGRRHLEFTSGVPFLSYGLFESRLYMLLQHFIEITRLATELLSFVKNSKWRLSAILNY